MLNHQNILAVVKASPNRRLPACQSFSSSQPTSRLLCRQNITSARSRPVPAVGHDPVIAGDPAGEHRGLGGAGDRRQHGAERGGETGLAEGRQPGRVREQPGREADDIDDQQGPHDESLTCRGEFERPQDTHPSAQGALRPAVADEVEDVLTEVCQPLFADTTAAEQGSGERGFSRAMDRRALSSRIVQAGLPRSQ